LFGAYMWAADATVFHGAEPLAQTQFIAATSVLQRLDLFSRGVVFEEVVFRLVIMTGVVRLLTAIAGTPRNWCYWAAILLVAFGAYPLFHLAEIAAMAPTAQVVLRLIALPGAASALWGYLYWRHGLAAAMVGHFCAHASLEPLRALPW
jgi:hypothetical protein